MRLVGILHFLSGAVLLLAGACYGVLFLRMARGERDLPPLAGSPYAWAALLAALLVGAALVFLSGDFIGQRRNRRASVLASLLLAPLFPLGTLLALYSLWVLTAPETRALYRAPAS